MPLGQLYITPTAWCQYCVYLFKFAPLTDLRPVRPHRSPDMFRYASACHPVVWTWFYDFHKLMETENPFTAPLETRQTTLQCNMYVFTMRKRARALVCSSMQEGEHLHCAKFTSWTQRTFRANTNSTNTALAYGKTPLGLLNAELCLYVQLWHWNSSRFVWHLVLPMLSYEPIGFTTQEKWPTFSYDSLFKETCTRIVRAPRNFREIFSTIPIFIPDCNVRKTPHWRSFGAAE